MKHAVLMLPFPPSTNGLYRNIPKVGRAKSKTYDAWLLEAGYMANKQKITAFDTRVDLVFHLDNDNDTSDCSNYIKAAEDFLVMRGIIKDDCKEFVRSVQAIWSDDVSNGCMIEIMEV